MQTARDKAAIQTLMRSGTAARLAGLSPSTLRIWEHRYRVVAPQKSASGQRNYSMQDIDRLRVIKRLTLQGHAIGTLAHLDVDALVMLSSGSAVVSQGAQRVLVAGHARRVGNRPLRPQFAELTFRMQGQRAGSWRTSWDVCNGLGS